MSASVPGSNDTGTTPTTGFQPEVVQKLEDIITGFRAGSYEMAIASSHVLCILLAASNDVNTANSAYVHWFDQLRHIDRDRTAAIDGTNPADPVQRPDDEDRESDHDSNPDDVPPPASRPVTLGANKRPYSGQDLFGINDVDDGSRPAKRTIDESMFPFYRRVHRVNIDPVLALTVKYKANYSLDLTLSVNRFLSQPDVPEFPRSLWTHVIAGGYVDLDRVLSSIFSLEGDTRETKRIGDFEVQTEHAKLSRRVTDHGQWIVAFTRYERAVVYAYPHRDDELRSYLHHIGDLFTHTAAAYHYRVINYDKAVRTRVGCSNQFLLTNISAYDDLKSSWCSNTGAGVSSSQSGGSGSQSRGTRQSKAPNSNGSHTSSETCRRFNQGKDHGPADSCSYKHTCTSCGSSSHGAHSCPSKRA